MRQPGLATDWTKHLKDDDAKQRFEDLIRNSTSVLGRLKEMLQERLDTVSRVEVGIAEYQSPSWSHKQAHRNGQRSALAELTNLLSFLDLKE